MKRLVLSEGVEFALWILQTALDSHFGGRVVFVCRTIEYRNGYINTQKDICVRGIIRSPDGKTHKIKSGVSVWKTDGIWVLDSGTGKFADNCGRFTVRIDGADHVDLL